MAQQTPIVLGWLTAPGQLLNQAATQLTMTLNDATSLAQAARQHMRALPGGPGLVEVSYKWLMLLCAAACTPAAQQGLWFNVSTPHGVKWQVLRRQNRC